MPESTETWGQRLTRLREARGLTKTELAAACARYRHRIDRNNVRRWEEGELSARIDNFAALARVLGVSMDVLFYGEEEAARIEAERRERGTT